MDDRVPIPTLRAASETAFIKRVVTVSLGQVCGQIAERLAQHGSQTISQLARALSLSQKDTTLALKSLAQHGFVAGGEDRGAMDLIPATIASSILTPAYVVYVGDVFGVEAEVIVEFLSEHGRLTGATLNALFSVSQPSASEAQMLRFMESCNELLQNGFLRRVPPNADGDTTDKMEEDAPLSASNDTVVVALHHETFRRALRNQQIVNYVSNRLDHSAGIVCKAMLSAARKEGPDPPEFTEMTLFDYLPDEANISRSQLRQILLEMLNDNVPIVEIKESMSCGEVYTVRVGAIVEQLRRRHTQAIVRAKFGDEAARIFMLLLEKRHLEEKSISELGLISKKSARASLYSMMNSEFVALQELPKSADRNPQRTLYLWSVPISRLYANLRSALRQAWVNLQLRLESETKAADGLVSRVQDGSATQAQQAEYQKFVKIQDRLVDSSCRILYDIVLFES